jgi:lysophospholipase L1-like esterase
MMIRTTLIALFLTSLTSLSAAEPFVLEPAPPGDPASTELPSGKPWIPGWCRWDWRAGWVGQHQGMVENTKAKAGKIDVVFFGDSLTQGWGDGVKALDPTLEIANYGIGGDSTRQILWRISNGAVDGISPRLVVLAIGTNNLYDDANSGSDEEVARGIATCVELLQSKLPHTRILVSAILPRQNDWFCGRAQRINAITAKLDDGKQVRVLNAWQAFYDETSTDANARVKKSLFNNDLLHLAAPGYVVWAEQIKPTFGEMTAPNSEKNGAKKDQTEKKSRKNKP